MIFISQLCRSVVALHELVNSRHPPHGDEKKDEKKDDKKDDKDDKKKEEENKK